MNRQISIIGQGYVGLPIAMAACEAGYQVIGIDTDRKKIEQLKSGISGLEDVSNQSVSKYLKPGKYQPTTEFEAISNSKVILICVPTPLNVDNLPDLSYVKSATNEISKYLCKDSLVILESTVGPGTTRDFMIPILEKGSGMPRQDFHVAFSPERIDPLNQNWNVFNTPKIIAGLTEESKQLAMNFYSRFVKTLVPVDSLEIAETAKLLENSFRLVNISFINEIAQFCQKLGVDVNSVIEAASTKPYGYMPFYPSLGVGGHCIPVDPIYLANKAQQIGATSRFIEVATNINLEMPTYFTDIAEKKLGSLNNKRVLIIGVSYKTDVSDVRQTPVSGLIEVLRNRGALVSWHDDLVKEWAGEKSVPLSPDYDLAILATPHSYLDLSKIGKVQLLNTRGSI
jgi:UDP-N-acetyl-D-glucosamine dehydrogenase